MRNRLAIAALCLVLALAALFSARPADAVRISQPGSSSLPAAVELGSIGNGGTATCNFAGTTLCHFTSGTTPTIANPTNLPTNAVVYIAATYTGGSTTITWGANFLGWVDNTGWTTLTSSPGWNTMQGGTNAVYVWPFWSDGTRLVPAVSMGSEQRDFYSNTVGVNGGTFMNTGGLRVGPAGENQVNSMARMPLSFPIAAVAATTTTQWGERKLVKAITVENVVFNVGAFTCSVNPTISLLDCSATAGTCTPVATLATSGTLTGIGSTNAATLPTANVAAGEYIAAEFTAGTCTVFNGSVEAMARPQ